MSGNKSSPTFPQHLAKQPLRAAVYKRVSNDTQVTEMQMRQAKQIEKAITKETKWRRVKTFIDKCDRDVKIEHRPEIRELLQACNRGQIDLVLTTFNDFGYCANECFNTVNALKKLSPPVGVYFINEKLYTLTSRYEVFSTVQDALYAAFPFNVLPGE